MEVSSMRRGVVACSIWAAIVAAGALKADAQAMMTPAAPAAAGAVKALDAKNMAARMVNFETLAQSVDMTNKIVDGMFGARQASTFALMGTTATLTLPPQMMPMNAAVSLPGADRPLMVNFGGIAVMVQLSDGRVTEAGEQKLTLNTATGAARLMGTSKGTIMLKLNVAGLNINQAVTFDIVSFAATDMGPLFVGTTAPAMGMAGAMAPAGAMMPAAGAMMRPLSIPGPGRVCARAGSPFLAMPMLGVPDCANGFTNLQQIDPKPFDAATGIVRGVGFQMIRLNPFMVAGIPIMVGPLVIANTQNAVERLTER